MKQNYETRRSTGETQRLVLEALKKMGRPATSAEFDIYQASNVDRVFRSLVKKGCVETWQDTDNQDRRRGRLLVNWFAYVKDLPPANPRTEQMREYHRERYLAKKAAKIAPAS